MRVFCVRGTRQLEDLKSRIQTHFAASKSPEDEAKEEATNANGGESLVFGGGEGGTSLKAAESRAAELAKRLATAESIILEQVCMFARPLAILKAPSTNSISIK